MGPDSTVDDLKNRFLTDAVQGGQFIEASSSLRVSASYGTNGIIGQFRSWMFHAFQVGRTFPTSFGAHVFRVNSRRSEKQVRWIDASRNVAAMADIKAICNWAVMNDVRQAVRSDQSAGYLSILNNAVSAMRVSARPYPTLWFRRFLNISPEPINQGLSLRHVTMITKASV